MYQAYVKNSKIMNIWLDEWGFETAAYGLDPVVRWDQAEQSQPFSTTLTNGPLYTSVNIQSWESSSIVTPPISANKATYAQPVLTGLDSVTFAENTVNAAPQLLDVDVIFNDPDDDFDGGTLTIIGILAEDTISVRNQGNGTGEIGFDGTNVSYGGVAIGTLAGGAGTKLTITFNATATSAAIDALIQNLTYSNSSDAPTTSRDLTMNITDAAGESFSLSQNDTFTAFNGVTSPFDGIGVGPYSHPSFVDIDGDGDFDLVVGNGYGQLTTYRNGDFGAPGAFTRLTSGSNPFDGIDVGNNSRPSFIDIDNDGDPDLVVGMSSGTIYTYSNGDNGTSGVFTKLTGAANPFDGIDIGFNSTPSFFDIDGDGDLDLVTGENLGTLLTYRNGDIGTSGAFFELIGADNPFDGIDVGSRSAPSFVDIDGDGDLDLVVGTASGILVSYRNGNIGTSGAFTALSGADNPFDGIDVGNNCVPSFFDFDSDGDLDLVAGERNGSLVIYENTAIRGERFTVTITPENDAPFVTGLPGAVSVFEDATSNLDLSALTLNDPDLIDVLTVVLSVSAGTLDATGGAGVTVTGTGTSTLTFVGTGTAIDTYLNGWRAVLYAGEADVFGDAAAILTLSGDDGTGVVQLGSIDIDIINVTETPVLTGLDSVTFAENTVNTTPQLLDIDVTFTDPDDNFDGGILRLYGLLAEDTVSVRNQGYGAGEIGFDGTNVSYGSTVIGTLAGGAGTQLTITFNAAATSTALDALIQNLTYANSSNAPTTSRDLSLNITDSEGADIRPTMTGDASFAMNDSVGDPFDGIDVGAFSNPSFFDIDNDGDLDLVVGRQYSYLTTYRNGDIGSSGAFTLLEGADNPFNGIYFSGTYEAPTFGDMDGDGDFDLVLGLRDGQLITYRNGDVGTSGTFTRLAGAANPFYGIDVGDWSVPSFVDFDGDGDQDLVVGEWYSGRLVTFLNGDTGTSGAFTQLSGVEDPFDGVRPWRRATPSFVDIDGDGDLDLVVGNIDGDIKTFRNGDVGTSGTFTELTGAANPFDGIDVGINSTPSFFDFDGDDDFDLVVGNNQGLLQVYENTTPNGIGFTVTITPENDAPIVTNLPTAVTVIEGIASNLDLSATMLTDVDTADNITVGLTVNEGILTAVNSVGVTVTGSGTATLSLVGTAVALNAYLHSTSAMQYTAPQNAFDDGPVSLTLSGDDGTGAVQIGTVNIDVTAVSEVPVLARFQPSAFAENTVNAAPQLLDTDVVFTDVENDFNGGMLTITGLLAEDTISVRHQGTGTAEIGFNGVNISYGGVVIGVLNGGTGSALSIVFNATATSAAVDALIQNLTYQNDSDTPIDSRDLLLNIIDAAGNDLGSTTHAINFGELTGVNNPFDGIDVGFRSKPSFVDIDGDGDLDLVVGDGNGQLRTYRNGDDGSSGSFTELIGATNPFDGIDVGDSSTPNFVDLDGDGDQDLVIGELDGTVFSYRNGSIDTAGAFTQLTLITNPFDGIDVGLNSTPIFVDLEFDGDLDLVIGNSDGTFITYRNGSDIALGAFNKLNGTANPFNGIDAGSFSAPSFVDIDGDGDLDLVAGNGNGQLRTYQNGDTETTGAFIELVGANNPFDGIDVGFSSTPNFVDLDGDGDMDLVVGNSDGVLTTFENTTSRGAGFTITVTPENDAPILTDLPTEVTVLEDTASNLNLSALTLSDADGPEEITLTLSVSAGIMNAASRGGMTVSGTGTSTLSLVGTISVLNAYLNTTSSVQYTGEQDVFGDAAATLTLSGDDGAGVVQFGTVNINITDVLDTRTGTSGDDTLFGDAGMDHIIGNAGNDRLSGGSGDDIIDGGDGDDRAVFSGRSSEYNITENLDGSLTIQHVSGGTDGTDTLISIETLEFSDGVISSTAQDLTTNDDTYSGTAGIDFIDGLDGDDTLNGLGGNDRLLGGAGDDRVSGGSGDDILFGGNGIDLLIGSSGDDTLNGDAGDDTLVGGPGADILNGGIGIDFLRGQGGDDILDGGAGDDRLVGASGNDVLLGGAGNDELYGVQSNDELRGGDGDDVLVGGGGTDILFGDAGIDTLNGGGGNDELYGGLGDDTLIGGSGSDILDGGDGADTLNGVGAADTINGGAGNDIINAGGGNDIVNGGADDDNIQGKGGADTLRGGDGNDTLDGGTASDTLFGDAGNDTLAGAGGKDRLDGGTGDDNLNGGGGNDTLIGGLGDDTMTGGSTSDRFIFDDGFGADTITDFEDNRDVLDFSAHSNLNTLAAVLAVASQVGVDTVIALDANNTLTLSNFTLADLNAADFDFGTPAEAPGADKAAVSEDIGAVSKKSVISNPDLSTTEKPVISDDDSFAYVDKPVIAEGFTASDTGDFVISQDIITEFLEQAQILRDDYIHTEGIFEFGPDYDGGSAYFHEFFSFL